MANSDDDFLTRCVVDPSSRRFYLYSDQGQDKVIDCDTLEDSVLSYANPLVAL